ncbi:Extradiol ring-cleavage dioxygenase, class III enzyme, subunit B [Roridomyces roridus]|uniref:Extradiol ring-cleavage dioxygenase, class III enzyme, subunit B n=1 Tax=Roridomyces roridus TaxID=1738132 RepID=A0AAD7CEF0_9AGAR|nr:Extradiol ring-cleavage dioxygenase, class III enzyme, subunit B [Roridomyces roridus]
MGRTLVLFILSILSALYLSRNAPFSRFALKRNMATFDLPTMQKEWRKVLDELPDTPEKIPAFFFGHGSPMTMTPAGASGPLATFLRDFGPALLKKYQPKGIVVFSAHWETHGERLGASDFFKFVYYLNLQVTDYGDTNPLLYDYYGFAPSFYQIDFKSRGDTALAQRVVDLYKAAGQRARLSPKTESRGQDGRGFSGPGFDHGVFVPFRIMFGNVFTDIPIVEVSIDASLSPEVNWDVGKALAKLREQGILVLSGGLTVHNLRDFSSFSPDRAKPAHIEFDRAIIEAVKVEDDAARKTALINLVQHPGFRACHPREEHFVPIYVAAGAGDGGAARLVTDTYGSETVAFGL